MQTTSGMIAGTVVAGAAVVGGAVGAGAAVVGATVVGATVAATAVVSVAESEELPHAPVTKTRLPTTAIAALARNFILNPLPGCSHRTGEAGGR